MSNHDSEVDVGVGTSSNENVCQIESQKENNFRKGLGLVVETGSA